MVIECGRVARGILHVLRRIRVSECCSRTIRLEGYRVSIYVHPLTTSFAADVQGPMGTVHARAFEVGICGLIVAVRENQTTGNDVLATKVI